MMEILYVGNIDLTVKWSNESILGLKNKNVHTINANSCDCDISSLK